MTKPKDTVWELEDHTLAKHRILQGYLSAWLPIMSTWNDRLVLVDGFAGPGVYKKGQPGSPIIMLNAFLEHTQRDRIKSELVYLFIENDAKRAARLELEIAKLKLPKNVRHEVINKSFDATFNEALDKLEEKGNQLAPTFAFVDPFGYTGAPMSLTGRFMQFDRCEVLIFVPLPWVNRFLSLPAQENALNSLFGTDRWKEALDLEDGRLRFLHDLFRDQLKNECGLKYVRSFEIVTAAANSGYHLFFGSKHVRGLEKMKEAMWAIDPAEGHRFRDSTKRGAMPLFEPEVDTAPLARALRKKFKRELFTIEEALEYTVLQTPYIKSHVKTRTLKPLEKAGELQADNASKERRAFSYPEGTRLRFT